jgi:hypothetical protein
LLNVNHVVLPKLPLHFEGCLLYTTLIYYFFILNPLPSWLHFVTNSALNVTSSVAWVRERTIPTERPPKLVPTFADRKCRVIRSMDVYGRILGFLDRSHNCMQFRFVWGLHSSGLQWNVVRNSTFRRNVLPSYSRSSCSSSQKFYNLLYNFTVPPLVLIFGHEVIQRNRNLHSYVVRIRKPYIASCNFFHSVRISNLRKA